MSYTTSDFRKGLRIEIDGRPYRIVDVQHIKKKRIAVYRIKIKDILTGAVLEKTFNAGERVDRPDLEEKEMQYLYNDDDLYYFMDNETFEQIAIERGLLEDIIPFLKENENVTVLFYNGKPATVELPPFVILEVVETEPGFKGDTVTTSFKPARVETGGTVYVPLFIEAGDLIKVNTEDFSYVERVKK